MAVTEQQRSNARAAIRQASREIWRVTFYLRRGAQLDSIRAVLLVYLRSVPAGIFGRGVQMYREGCAAHVKDVLDRVFVVLVHLAALDLVDELAELASRRGRRIKLCNRVTGTWFREET